MESPTPGALTLGKGTGNSLPKELSREAMMLPSVYVEASLLGLLESWRLSLWAQWSSELVFPDSGAQSSLWEDAS